MVAPRRLVNNYVLYSEIVADDGVCVQLLLLITNDSFELSADLLSFRSSRIRASLVKKKKIIIIILHRSPRNIIRIHILLLLVCSRYLLLLLSVHHTFVIFAYCSRRIYRIHMG